MPEHPESYPTPGWTATCQGWALNTVTNDDDGDPIWQIKSPDGGVLTTTARPQDLLVGLMEFLAVRSVGVVDE